jgi:hypothetical protein
MMPPLLRVLSLLTGLAGTACGSVRYPIGGDSGADAMGDRTTVVDTKHRYLVDLLFVIDNSNSMEPKQKALTAAFPKLIEGLKVGGSLPDLHVGVVSSDLGTGPYSISTCETIGGDGGKLHSKAGQLAPAGCPTPSDSWISISDGATNISSGPADPVERVKAAFTCIASLGVAGCGFEQPLESVRHALDPALAVNPGFLRDEALLVVFFITDEDDCSASDPTIYDPNATTTFGPMDSYRCTRFGLQCNEDLATTGAKTGCKPGGTTLFPPAAYISFFSGLKPKGKVLLAALAGPTSFLKVTTEGSSLMVEPTCQTTNGAAAPALRLEAVITGLAGGSFFNAGIDASEAPVSLNVCNLELDPALRFLAKKIVTAF